MTRLRPDYDRIRHAMRSPCLQLHGTRFEGISDGSANSSGRKIATL